MRLERRKIGGWVLIAKHRESGLDAETPFEVVERKDGKFELWAYASDNDDEMTLHDENLSKKQVLDLAETMLPPQWEA